LRIAAIAFEAQEGMSVTDASGSIIRVNQAFTKITGYTAEEVVGKNSRVLKSGRHNANFFIAMWECINRTGSWAGEIWNRNKSGEIYPAYLTITEVKDKNGSVTHYVATFNDITLSKASEEEIRKLAFYDPLTGLSNRRLLIERFMQAVASSSRSGKQGALLFIDLDNFKDLNDSLGHEFGDLLLQQVAERLKACVRESDTVARQGGDEFVIMLEDLNEQDAEAAAQSEVIANKILASLNQDYLLGIHEYHNTPSIGVVLFNKFKWNFKELFQQADIAMYQAKKEGRNGIRFYDPRMQEAITTRVNMERDLLIALKENHLRLYYQMQIDNDGKIVGAEALIRWQHPQQGLIYAVSFIPLAEESGLIVPIGIWVLNSACDQLKAWQQHELTCDLVLSINISARQFKQLSFVADVQTAIQHYGINPTRLMLELTESMLLSDIEDTIEKMTVLKGMGILFALDDFGTGYSSLQYLKRLPIDQLKIDQSFVRDIMFNSSDEIIVRTIIIMAQTLILNVIAEGVETDGQRQYLHKNGCYHYQGYLFGRPLPLDEFEEMLKRSVIPLS
jgi:diguanylate cyclase (GGDEF)-like protein/PAS domain S-box-containing protein